eukprot:scaffold124600_cov20-Tisochrysis_lutea.AAC.2
MPARHAVAHDILCGVEVGVPGTEDLVPPVALLSGPPTFRTPCPNEDFATLFVDSSGSGDASGRPLHSRVWGLRSGGGCVVHDANDGLSGVIETANR